MGRAEEKRIGKLEVEVASLRAHVECLLKRDLEARAKEIQGAQASKALEPAVQAVSASKLKDAVVKAHDEAFKDFSPPPSSLGAYTPTTTPARPARKTTKKATKE